MRISKYKIQQKFTYMPFFHGIAPVKFYNQSFSVEERIKS